MANQALASLSDIILQSGLLDETQVAELTHPQPAVFLDSKSLARDLIARGWLTPFQVNQLAKDRGQDLILGPYIILERLDKGGMGEVFKARHRVMNRIVALKVIRPEFVSNAEAVARFQREIRAVARLSHPNIVVAYDANQIGDRHFFVMEFIEGANLNQIVKSQGPLAVSQACDIIRQALQGLAHAHEHHLIHRDLKPANLLMTADGTIKILDLGLARLQGDEGESTELTARNAVMGTPDFIAPEQTQESRQSDIRADIYSLACTFYFLLTGKPPFMGGSTVDKFIKHREIDPAPVEGVRPEVPRALAEILRRMMAKRPGDRYKTPALALAALEPFCQGHVRNDWHFPAKQPGGAPGAAGVEAEKSTFTTEPYTPPSFDWAPADSGKESPAPSALPAARRRLPRRRLLVAIVAAAAAALLGGILWITTDNGQLKIDCKVDDVKVVVTKGGTEFEVIDLKSGTMVRRLPSGEYEIRLKGKRADVKLNKNGFAMTRWGQVIVTVTREAVVAKPANRKTSIPSEKIVLFDGKDLAKWTNRDGTQPADWPVKNGSFEVKPAKRGVKFGSRNDIKTKANFGPDFQLHAEFWIPSGTEKELFGNSNSGIYLLGRYEVQILHSDAKADPTRKCAALYGQTAPRKNAGKPAEQWQSLDITFHAPRLGDNGAVVQKGRITVIHNGVTVINDAEFDQVSPTGLFDNHSATGPIMLQDHNSQTGVRFRNIWLMPIPPAPTKGKTGALDAMRREDIRPFDLAAAGGGDPEKAPQELVGVIGDSRMRHWGEVRAVACSPDGKHVASGGVDRKVRVWDTATGDQVFTLLGHASIIQAVAYSGDGKRIASAGWDQTIKVWDAKTGKIVRTLTGHNRQVYSLAFSPKSDRLVSGGADFVGVWDLSRKESALQLKLPKQTLAVAFSPDGKRIATAAWDEVVRIWDADSGKELHTLKELMVANLKEKFPGSPSLPNWVFSVAFSPDGKQLAAGSRDGIVAIWDVESGKFVQHLQATGEVWTVAYHPSGRRLACASEPRLRKRGQVQIWDTKSWQPVRSIPTGARGSRLAYSRDGKFLAIGCFQSRIRICDANTGRDMLPQHVHSNITAIGFTGDGQRLAVAGQFLFRDIFDVVKVRDLQSNQDIVTLKIADNHRFTLFSPGASHVASHNHTVVSFWDVGSGRRLSGFSKASLGKWKWKKYRVQALLMAFTPDGERVAAGLSNGDVMIWNVKGGDNQKPQFIDAHGGRVTALLYTPDGQSLVTGGNDSLVKIWSAGGYEHKADLFGHAGSIQALAMTKDGRVAASACGPATGVKEPWAQIAIWNFAKRKKLKSFQGDAGRVVSMSFSPGGALLACAGDEGRVSLWDTSSGKRVRTWQYPGFVKSVLFAPDGRHLLTVNGNGTVYILRLAELREESSKAQFFFNKIDLTGWTGLAAHWRVKNGALVASSEQEGIDFNTSLCSDREYGDFELRFKVRLKGDVGNSGVNFRSEIFDPQKMRVRGPQCDIGSPFWGNLYGEKFGGMMQPADAQAVAKVLRKGDFNDFFIRCVGKHVTIRLNGVTTVDGEFPKMRDRGIIAWQLHSGPAMEVTFKDIEFRELTRQALKNLENKQE